MKIMKRKQIKKDPALDVNLDICCCPLCSSEEFLLSENEDELVCIDCGLVPLNTDTKYLTSTSQFQYHKFPFVH